MADELRTASLTAVSVEPQLVDTDLIVLPAFEDERVPDRCPLDEATGGELRRAVESGEFRGKTYDFFLTPLVASSFGPRRAALIGGGRRRDFDASRARNLAAAAGIAARERRVERLAFVLESATGAPPLAGDAQDAVFRTQAIAEGLVLGEHVGGKHKTADRPRRSVREAAVVIPRASPAAMPRLVTAASRGRMLGECSNLCRELADEPGGILTPRAFVERAAEIVAGTGVTTEVLDESAMAELGMGLLLGVARGSHEPPRLLVLRHDPPGAPQAPVLGLVGKGITFDAGGLSIKSAAAMERMKDDMSGGAAVVCALRAIGALGAPVRVVGVVPCAENMPGGGAIRPGDVLRGASGKTVEVIDTDAEGRLVLADALWYAARLGATHLMDVATLTGACQVALGKTTSGLMGRPAAWVQQICEVANRAGDRSWILPLFDDYRDQLRSEVADLVNVGGRPAGAITAAMFLREFTDDRPWAHMDIAGTAWLDDARPFAPKGPTGVAVRTLAELAFTRFQPG